MTEYNQLPTVKLIEGIMLPGQVSKIGFGGLPSPKITDDIYIEIIKQATVGDKQ